MMARSLLLLLASFLLLCSTVAEQQNLRRSLQWIRPSWWLAYRQTFGSEHLLKCPTLLGIAPAQGSACSPKPIDWYLCLFGNQECTSSNTTLWNSTTHPETRCDCRPNSNNEWTWDCYDLDPCIKQTTIAPPAPVMVTECPIQNPIGSTNPDCAIDLTCHYGEESCCGETFSSVRCSCQAGSTFRCLMTDACFHPSCFDVCPLNVPAEGDACLLVNVPSCTYGEFRCCGQDVPTDRFTCTCEGGKFTCVDISQLLKCPTCDVLPTDSTTDTLPPTPVPPMSLAPSNPPTSEPTSVPTPTPTSSPTPLPSLNPTTLAPTNPPSSVPTPAPTPTPTSSPTPLPSLNPTSLLFDAVTTPTLSPPTTPSLPLTRVATSRPTAPLVQAAPASAIIYKATFDAGVEGFVYQDNTFRGTNQPSYANGVRLSTGGFSGGALQVTLGGVDNNAISGMSGGWKLTFSLPATTVVSLSLRFLLTQTAQYENDELSQALVSVDGILVGQKPYDLLAVLVGNGNGGSGITTGWKKFEANLGSLNAGSHTLVLGGYNSKKTASDESTVIIFDEVTLATDQIIDTTLGPKAVVGRLDLERFKSNIQTLANFGDRTQGSSSYNNAAAWVKTQLEAVGYVVKTESYSYNGASRSSMYVTKVGVKFPDRMFLVTAHLDGRGGGGAADDDASGCSCILEIARALAGPDVTSDVSVRMIFWNNEETGLNGSAAYASQRVALQGQENPANSGIFPEPTWLGIIQHDMILFDHGVPPQVNQIQNADCDVEYQASSTFATLSAMLALALFNGNVRYAQFYPAQVTNNMSNTDSVSFMNIAPSCSFRENRRLAEIGSGSNPNWHQLTDRYSTYSALDYVFGFNIVQTTLGSVSELAGVKIV